MSLNFIQENFIIGQKSPDLKPTFTFYKKGFRIGNTSPSWQDIILSGNTALTLTNAKANGLNYIKLFGGTEQNGTPTPDSPVDIVCNNGTIKVSPNLFDFNTITSSTITIPVENGQTYIWSFDKTNYDFRWDSSAVWGVDSNGNTVAGGVTLDPSSRDYGVTSYFCITVNSPNVVGVETTFRNNKMLATVDNIKASKMMFQTGTERTTYHPYGQIYTDGTQEVVTDSLGNTANAEMLLSVGDYKDTQEVTSGNVTRNVGIKVLDGSENWGLVDGTTSVYRGNINYMTFGSIVFCTHYPSISSDIAASNMPNDTIKMHNTVNGLIYIRDASKATAQEFSNYLADQYNAGTPVTIVYPLATATTETVTGQPLSISAGTNIITAEGSIDNLELEVSYKATA